MSAFIKETSAYSEGVSKHFCGNELSAAQRWFSLAELIVGSAIVIGATTSIPSFPTKCPSFLCSSDFSASARRHMDGHGPPLAALVAADYLACSRSGRIKNTGWRTGD